MRKILHIMRHPEHGYAYLGLYADNGSEPGIKAGVNQKGLAVRRSQQSAARATGR
ncbi:carcinine hydrolase/isopenicillin-N N-acyltransferase family protein [Chromobacterium violaceum]|uniref:carcinine hydrolase/isopenicillin-N N-acyltransferase family protein n=1 Tax=Chromobacterium violaceum TaxID=536 RepID=UPI0035A6CC04